MQDQVFGAEGEGALDLPAEGGNGLLAEEGGLAAQVDEIAGVDDEGKTVVVLAETAHLGAVVLRQGLGAPHAGARGEDLEGVRAEFVGTLGRAEDAAGGGEMHADAGRHGIWAWVLGYFSRLAWLLIADSADKNCSLQMGRLDGRRRRRSKPTLEQIRVCAGTSELVPFIRHVCAAPLPWSRYSLGG